MAGQPAADVARPNGAAIRGAPAGAMTRPGHGPLTAAPLAAGLDHRDQRPVNSVGATATRPCRFPLGQSSSPCCESPIGVRILES